MATRSLGVLTIDLIAKTSGFERDMDRASGRVKSTAKDMDAASRVVEKYIASIGAAAVAFAGAAAAMAVSSAKAMDATSKMAQQIGITTESLTEMRFAAQQFANISDQQFDMSVRRMTRRIVEAADGAGAAATALDAMGLSASELAKLTPDRQLLAVADAMQRTESQANRLRYAMALFDTEGMALVPALQQGSAALEQNIQLARRFGVVLSTEAAQAAEQFTANLGLLQKANEGFRQQLAEAVLPTLVDVSGYLVAIAERAGPAGETIEKALKIAGVTAAATAVIFASRLTASVVSSAAAFTAATVEAARYQATLARMAGVSSAAAAAIGGLGAVSRVASVALSVLGGPVGLIASVGLTAAAFATMGRLARVSSMDIDSLTDSLESLNAEQIAFRQQQAEEKLADLQREASEAARALASVEREYGELHAEMDAGRGVTPEGLENVRKTLVQMRSELADANQEVGKAEQALAKLEAAARAAAGGLGDFNSSIIETNDAASKYLEQLGRRTLLAGATTELEKLNRLIKSGELVFADGGEQARKLAAQYDSATVSMRAGSSAAKDHASAMRSLLEVHLPQNKALADLHKNLGLLQSAQKAGLVSTKEYDIALRSINEAYADQIESLLPEHIKAAREMADEAEKQLKQLQDQVAHFGTAESAVMELARAETTGAIAKLEATRATEVANKADAERIRIIDEELTALRRLQHAQGQSIVEQRALEALDAQSKVFEEGKRAAEELERTLTDALMRGFESGKSFAENLRDTLRNLFNTLVLRPIIQPIAQSAAESITGFMGVGQSRPGMSGLGSMGNIAGVGAAPGTTAIANAWGATGGDQMGAFIAGNSGRWGVSSKMAGNVSAGLGYAAALYALTEEQYGTAVGTAIGTAILPGVGTVIGSVLGGFADSFLGDMKGETRTGGSFQLVDGQALRTGGPSGGADQAATQFAQNLLSNASDALNRAFTSAGVAAELGALLVAFEDSEKGRGGTYSFGDLVIDGQAIRFGAEGKGRGHGGTSGTLQEMMANAEVDAYQTVIQGWQAAIDLFPSILQNMIRGIDADSLGLEAAQALVQQFVATAEQTRALADAMGELPFVPAIAATFDFAAALAEATGGAENAANLFTSFYQNYVRESERTAHLTAKLTDEFATLGYELPRTRDEMFALVQANLALGDAGAQTVAKLLSMESALSSILPAFDAAGDVGALFAAQLQVVRDAAAEANRLLGIRTTAGTLLDRINRNSAFAGQREAELWAAMQTASYEQQISLASQLTDIVLARYDTEIAAAERMRDIGRSLRDYLDSLATSDLAPTNLATKVSEAERQLQDAVARARAGDEGAMQSIQGLTQNALELWRRYGASGDAYQDAYNRITGTVGDLADQAMSDAERQLSVSQSTLAQIEQLRGVAQTAYGIIDAQYQAAQQSLTNETYLLTELGTQTGQLNDIAGLLGSMPAELAAILQPMLSAAMGGVVSGWYQGTGISPDQSAVDYWSGQLGSRPQDQVESDFYKTLASNWYLDAGRQGDMQGIEYWASQAQAQGAQQAYEDFLRTLSLNSHRDGLYSVPYDNYPALLHREEAVLTAAQAREWRAPSAGESNAVLVAEIKALRNEVKALREENNRGNAGIIGATRQTATEVAEAARLGVREARLATSRQS